MTKADDLLKEAITGEFNAMQRYTKFAEIALAEKLPNVARVFKAFFEAEKIHFNNHTRALGNEGKGFTPKEEPFTPGTTLQNLEASMIGEAKENEEMYPEFMKAIKKELKTDKGKLATLSMQWAREAEKTHLMLMQKIIEEVKLGKDFTTKKVFVCLVCGNVFTDMNIKAICEICGHDATFYKEIEA